MQQDIFSDYFAGLELMDISGPTMQWMAIIRWRQCCGAKCKIQMNHLMAETVCAGLIV